ncbi:MAG: aldehyde dehydrogenase family protein [Vicinamibacteria bacterium]
MTTFKVTYSTLSSPPEEMHQAYESALARVREGLGKTQPIWVADRAIRDRATFENRSPIDRDLLIARHQEATAADTEAAIDAALDAFESWSRTPWRERLVILRRAADMLSERRNDLAALMTLEVGKNRYEALADAEESADLIRYYSQQMEDASGFDRPMGRLSENERTRDILRPYGVWAVIAPFNFPLALAAGMSAGALIAGNTVVFKPSPDAPTTGLELLKILREAGLPAGAMSYLTDSGAAVGKTLVASPKVSGVVFTGSKNVGFTLFKNFNDPRPRPCFLELGGKNPTIVTANADLEKAAEGVMRGAFGFSGQKCSATSRVYVHRDVAARFRELLVGKTRNLEVGDPTKRESFTGPVINQRACDVYKRTVEEARAGGGRILIGGEVLTEGDLSKGYFVAPTIVDRLPPDHRLFREELFVPFVAVAQVDSLDEAIEEANEVEYGLTAGIFSEDKNEVETFFDRVEAGILYANRRTGSTTGAWPGVNPFCGWKSSGSSGKGVCGPYYVQQFLREQSQTFLE